jgi:hypothetical protein
MTRELGEHTRGLDTLVKSFVIFQYKCMFQNRGKITNIPNKLGAKSHGHIFPSVQKLTPLRRGDGIGAKWCFILKSQE